MKSENKESNNNIIQQQKQRKNSFRKSLSETKDNKDLDSCGSVHTDEFSQHMKELSRKSGTIITLSKMNSPSDDLDFQCEDLNLSSSQEIEDQTGW